MGLVLHIKVNASIEEHARGAKAQHVARAIIFRGCLHYISFCFWSFCCGYAGFSS